MEELDSLSSPPRRDNIKMSRQVKLGALVKLEGLGHSRH
jgi:hypothetical protein